MAIPVNALTHIYLEDVADLADPDSLAERAMLITGQRDGAILALPDAGRGGSFGSRQKITDRNLNIRPGPANSGTLVVSGVHSEQVPGARHTLELVLASVLEIDPGAGDKVDNGARHKHLARMRPGLHSLGEVYRHT